MLEQTQGQPNGQNERVKKCILQRVAYSLGEEAINLSINNKGPRMPNAKCKIKALIQNDRKGLRALTPNAEGGSGANRLSSK